MDALRKRVQADATDGRYELYKTTARHEGAVGREQHGFPSDQELTAEAAGRAAPEAPRP